MSEIQQTTHSELQSQITIVSQVFYPDQQSTSLLLSDLASQLSQQGVNVHVLASYSAKNSTPKKDTAKADTHTDNNTDQSVHKNIEINTGKNGVKTEASDTKSFKLLLKIFCKSFKKIVKYNTNPIIPYLRMKNK